MASFIFPISPFVDKSRGRGKAASKPPHSKASRSLECLINALALTLPAPDNSVALPYMLSAIRSIYWKTRRVRNLVLPAGTVRIIGKRVYIFTDGPKALWITAQLGNRRWVLYLEVQHTLSSVSAKLPHLSIGCWEVVVSFTVQAFSKFGQILRGREEFGRWLECRLILS